VDQLVLLEIECPHILVGRNDDALHDPKLHTKVVAFSGESGWLILSSCWRRPGAGELFWGVCELIHTLARPKHH
jgi:hypothetical protein